MKTKEELIAYNKAYYLINNKKIQEQHKKYRKNNRKKLHIRAKKNYIANKDNPSFIEKRKKIMKQYNNSIAGKAAQQKYDNKPGAEAARKAIKKKYENSEQCKKTRKTNAHRQRKELQDIYIKKLLAKVMKCSYAKITQDMIDLKRIQIQLKRAIKNENINT